MNVAELIRAFATQERLPIDVNDILAHVRRNGCQDDIEFIGVDLDPDVLQGMIKIFHVRDVMYGEPRRCANIYYHRGHTADWQRFICCKEMIHLLDPSAAMTGKAEEIDQLAERIGLPPEMQDPLSDGFATNIDRLAEFRAAALLLPMSVRDLLIEPFRDGRLRLQDIARMADIPGRYVALVMSDRWPAVHEALTRI